MKFGNKNEAIKRAVQRGDYGKVNMLIKTGAVDYNYLNYLMENRSMYGDIDAVKLLIESGATDYDRAIRAAAEYGHLNIVKLLIEAGAIYHGETIILAAYYGHIDIVEFMLEIGAIQVSDAAYDMAIGEAEYNGKDDIVDFLEKVKEAGSYKNWKDKKYNMFKSLDYSKVRYYWDPYDDEKCTICQEFLVNDSTVDGSYLGDPVKTGCDHKFHEKCLLGWKKTGSNSCPMCRSRGQFFGSV